MQIGIQIDPLIIDLLVINHPTRSLMIIGVMTELRQIRIKKLMTEEGKNLRLMIHKTASKLKLGSLQTTKESLQKK
jgi:hypothetical protein